MTEPRRSPVVLVNLITIVDQMRGVERYQLGLLKALAELQPPYSLIILSAPWQRYFEAFDGLPGVSRVTMRPPRSRLRRGLWQLVDGGIRGRDFDLLHLGNVFPIPLGLRRPMTAMVFDMTEFKSPRAYGRVRRLARRAMVHWIGRQARVITTMAESTARDLRFVLHLAPERVVAIGTGIDSWPIREVRPWAERDRALVYVGGVDPNKRLDLVVEALATIPELRLKIISAGGPAEKVVRSLAQACGVADRIDWLGRLDDAEARLSVASSTALVLASDVEGFGLPILESLQVGTPVIISSTLPFARDWEAVGGPVFRAGDAADLARATRALMADPEAAAQLCDLGPRMVEDFTWPVVARRLDGVFRSVLGLPHDLVE